jgi:hypothetical protein
MECEKEINNRRLMRWLQTSYQGGNAGQPIQNPLATQSHKQLGFYKHEK